MKRMISTLFALLLLAGVAAGAVDRIQLTQLASGLDDPLGVVNAGDGSDRLFVVLQPGRILIWDGGQFLPTPFLNIENRVSCCGERGLLGLAFHPDYTNNGELYVNYTDNSGDTVIARYSVSQVDPDVADPNSEEILLTIDQPFSNHNGGQINFGPDGYLYIGTGDGGSAGDPGNRAQNLQDLLGKMLRIDVDTTAPYGIPADNPFVGNPAARDEIWAYGLRNPWRFSFDRDTGDMFIGDVGQNLIEEIDYQLADSPGGENYGWRLMEGSDCFDPPSNCNDGTLTLPILEYEHFGGGGFNCSVTGGYRYRGANQTEIDGLLIYGDYCSGKIWAGAQVQGDFWVAIEALDTNEAITSFGEDEDGELYMVEQGGGFFLVEGVAAPLCEVAMSAASYGVGDTVTIDSLRVANPTGSNVSADVVVGIVVPGVGFNSLVDVGVTLSPGFDQTLGPIPLGVVTGSFPLGTYTTVCQLIESGDLITLDTADFDVE